MRGKRIITLSLRPHAGKARRCRTSCVSGRRRCSVVSEKHMNNYMCFSRKAALYGREYHSRGSLAIDVLSMRKRFFLQYLSDTISVPISSRSFGPNRAMLRCFPCKYISIICGGKRLVWRDLVSKSQESSWPGNRIPRQERY